MDFQHCVNPLNIFKETSRQCPTVFVETRQLSKTCSLTHPNQYVFVPKPYQTISTAFHNIILKIGLLPVIAAFGSLFDSNLRLHGTFSSTKKLETASEKNTSKKSVTVRG